MLILSNCLTENPDEGCLKVAGNLIKRIKNQDSDVTVVSYERRSPLTDVHLELNKLLLNRNLIALLRQRQETVLYIPFPAKAISLAARICVLSRISPGPVHVLMTMTARHSAFAKKLLLWSGAHIMALSREAADFYGCIVGNERVTYLKTGVDTRIFSPVSEERAKALKRAYGFDPQRPVVLHVGHLKPGRNIAQLKKLDRRYQVLLVVSPQTREEQDPALREELCRAGVRIMDGYLPDIQEIYQLSDVYFFPVVEEENCIDVPLSTLEAAACGKPVAATNYGEIKSLLGNGGFYPITSFDDASLNGLIAQALDQGAGNIRQAVLDYDWENAACLLGKLDSR